MRVTKCERKTREGIVEVGLDMLQSERKLLDKAIIAGRTTTSFGLPAEEVIYRGYFVDFTLRISEVIFADKFGTLHTKEATPLVLQYFCQHMLALREYFSQ